MQDVDNIKTRVAEMSRTALEMWQLTYRAFMEQDTDLFAQIMEREGRLNESEKELTKDLVTFSRLCVEKQEKENMLTYADIVGDLELIGDYCKDLLERIEIKIQEGLLFSDDAVKEYAELFHKAEAALTEVTTALESGASSTAKAALKEEGHIDNLVDQYRRHHNQRLVDGTCSPLACNMFLNILDFTAAVYYHTKKVARGLLKLK